VSRGGTADITITLARNGFAGDAVVTLGAVGDAGVTGDGGADGGGAAGIGASPLTIASGSTTGILHVFASGTATLGATMLAFTVTADKTSTLAVPALIGGPPGSVDTTFGINGVAALVTNYQPVSVAVGDDDSIWVVNNTWKVLHYRADGTPDDTINAKFATTLASPGGSSSRIAVRGAVVLICGSDGVSPTLRKLTTGGDYDPTFASGGIFQPKQSSNIANGSFTGVAFTPTGDILLSAVITGPTSNLGGVVYRVTSAKTDTFVIGTPFSPEGVGVDPTGHIGTGGSHTTVDGGANVFGQVIDDAFHDAGLSSIGSPADGYTVQKAVVTSASQIAIATTRNHFLPSGSLATFSTTTGASVFLYEPSHSGTWDQGFNAVAAQADGKMLVADESGGGPMERAYVARVGTDGAVDPSFLFSVGSPGSTPFITFIDLAVDSVGRVVAAGTSDTSFYLTRAWP